MRTLESHLQYYDRWAKSWEFQALLKARLLAGDAESATGTPRASRPRCGRARRARASSSPCSACANASPSTSRPTRSTCSSSSAPADSATSSSPSSCCSSSTARRMPRSDSPARCPGAGRPRRARLRRAGGIGRVLARLPDPPGVEHRLQLARLRRTHPHADASRRVLARARPASAAPPTSSRPCGSGPAGRVRGPTSGSSTDRCSAVAALPADGLELDERAGRRAARRDRLPRPAGALAHIGALTAGVSRRARRSSGT